MSNHERTAATAEERHKDYKARFDRGDFDACFEVSVQEDATEAGFKFAAYLARSEHDPASDFDTFLDKLWRQVANLFEVHGPVMGPGKGAPPIG